MKDKIYEYIKSNDRYKIIRDDFIMKNPVTREWVDAVMYEQYSFYTGENSIGYLKAVEPKVFVREKKEFLEKFVEVTDENIKSTK